jgi:hypothetical protein
MLDMQCRAFAVHGVHRVHGRCLLHDVWCWVPAQVLMHEPSQSAQELLPPPNRRLGERRMSNKCMHARSYKRKYHNHGSWMLC